MTIDRWVTSCHEAGHAIAALALNGTCQGVLLTADGGLVFAEGLYQDREAYMVAAGPASEQLANEFEAPTCEPIPLDEVASNPIGSDQAFARWTAVADCVGVNAKAGVSDDQSLARWAICGHESEPDTWLRRLVFAKHIADQIVEKNKEAILRVARALYRKGALTEPEIRELYEGME